MWLPLGWSPTPLQTRHAASSSCSAVLWNLAVSLPLQPSQLLEQLSVLRRKSPGPQRSCHSLVTVGRRPRRRKQQWDSQPPPGLDVRPLVTDVETEAHQAWRWPLSCF